MWARRLGVPHLWPSRVKVFFLGLMTSVVIFSVFQYLHGANVEYLDLSRPVEESIRCKAPREECQTSEDPVRCIIALEDNRIWTGLNLSRPCPVLPITVGGQTCQNPILPLSAVTGNLGSLHTVAGVNPFKLWSILFLILTSLLSLSIVIHDLALLEESLRPSILSIPNMKYATPRLWTWMSSFQCRRRMWKLQRKRRCLWTCLVPLWMVSQILVFMAVLYPVALTVYFLAPVQMSRIMVFLSAILCMLWSIIFVVETALDAQPYAVLWGTHDAQSGLSCVCMCEFFLSRSVIMRVVVLSIGVCWNSFNLTFRALKGLRRAQWANMFSVLYAVPVEAFPVVWTRPPGAGPIRFRSEGEAIQSEPAFDPFCLMDEQPESAWMRPEIKPDMWTEHQQLVWEPYAGALDTEIGCCGFPRPMHSTPSVWDARPDEVGFGEVDELTGEEDGGEGASPKARRARDADGFLANGAVTHEASGQKEAPYPAYASDGRGVLRPPPLGDEEGLGAAMAPTSLAPAVPPASAGGWWASWGSRPSSTRSAAGAVTAPSPMAAACSGGRRGAEVGVGAKERGAGEGGLLLPKAESRAEGGEASQPRGGEAPGGGSPTRIGRSRSKGAEGDPHERMRLTAEAPSPATPPLAAEAEAAAPATSERHAGGETPPAEGERFAAWPAAAPPAAPAAEPPPSVLGAASADDGSNDSGGSA